MKYLSMTDVVTKKTNLTKDKGQVSGIAKLKPEVVHNQEKDNTHDQQTQGEKKLICIISRLLV
jgi:hypothetical protein